MDTPILDPPEGFPRIEAPSNEPTKSSKLQVLRAKRNSQAFWLRTYEFSNKIVELTLREPFRTLVLDANRPVWLGMRDSNPRMVGPEPTALPLGESPTVRYIVTLMRSFVQFF